MKDGRQTTITSINLEKRELFEFSTVCAFPNSSKIGLDFKILLLIVSLASVVLQKYSINCFVVSDLPEPEYPETTIV